MGRIQPERIQHLNDGPVQNRDYVLYWMQASQRTRWNHALEYAVDQANELKKPLLVCFGLTPSYPGANKRHYRFLLEGLKDVESGLAKRGIGFAFSQGEPVEVALRHARNACLVITDRGYTPTQRLWREKLDPDCRATQVESDVVVPVEWASTKEEYAARTLRPKIHRLLPEYLIPLRHKKVQVHWSGPTGMPEVSLNSVDGSVAPSPFFHGGEKEAQKRLRRFLKGGLECYDKNSNDPALDSTSHLSPYLHFGQISPLEIALAVEKADKPDGKAFLEQLIVRRELAINFCYFNKDCHRYKGLPGWCKATLQKHAKDKRPYLYDFDALVSADTHDPFWNAAQLQMVKTGFMHNYMRMYWGKKVLEWSPEPEAAFDTLRRLNDTYELDGRDPNGWTGVAWCFGKHDRPWTERPVFGTIRYMNAAGLKRKFDIERYVEWVAGL